MDPVQSLVIHEILPTEILKIIFEEHAILEWKAPTIDGQVCRLWRRIVLNTPRAWAYLTIPTLNAPRMSELRLWLHRASPAPLHIDARAAEWNTCQQLYDSFGDDHKRIVSLRTRHGSQSFFEGRDFPCLRLLDVEHWYPIRWGSMPKLQSLRLRDKQLRIVPLSELAPLKMLSLSGVRCTSVLRHSQSLANLMIMNVFLVDAIVGPLNFPSLTYLSLFGVRGLKRHINAPRLETYHEGRAIAGESFNISLPSMVEYGVYHPNASNSNPTKLHLSFPNIQRLAIRADEPVLLSFFTSLADQPRLLPALQTISAVGVRERTYQIAEGVQEKIGGLVLVRNGACDGNVVVCFETGAPFQIPIFFGATPDRAY